jgi:hypothetical protein
MLSSVFLAWMDKRRNRLLNIGEPGASGEVVKITDVQTFPLSFWFLCLACLSYYGAIFPFVSLAKDFFREEFGMDGQEANFITGVNRLQFVDTIFSPSIAVRDSQLVRTVKITTLLLQL